MIPLAEFGLPESEKMFGHDGGWLKKIRVARDILPPSGVSLAAIKPHRLDGDGQCARQSVGQWLCVMSPNNCFQCAT